MVKTLQKFSSSEPVTDCNETWYVAFVMQAHHSCSYYDAGLTSTYFVPRSNLIIPPETVSVVKGWGAGYDVLHSDRPFIRNMSNL